MMIRINLGYMLPKAVGGAKVYAAGLLRLLGLKNVRRFSWGKTSDVTLDVYRRALGGDPSRQPS